MGEEREWKICKCLGMLLMISKKMKVTKTKSWKFSDLL